MLVYNTWAWSKLPIGDVLHPALTLLYSQDSKWYKLLIKVAKALFYQYVMLTCGLLAAATSHALYDILYCVAPLVVEVVITKAIDISIMFHQKRQ